MQDLTYGQSKPHVDVTIEDILRHPIWMWAVDEEGFEGQDETWRKPVTNSTDVGEELVYSYPIITYRIVGTEIYGDGDYDHYGRQMIFDRIWVADRWSGLNEIDPLSEPILLEAVPTILGQAGVRFRAKKINDMGWSAERIN